MVIAHGAAEHVARYQRIASLLVDDGLVVYGLDHRGHGRSAADHGIFGVARPGGWVAMVDDLIAVAARAGDAHPGLPMVLFGHSMGSLLAQRVLQVDGDRYAGAILSGTSGGLDDADDVPAMLTGIEAVEGADAPSALFAGMFAGFNDAFRAEVGDPTGFEWLSRDRDEVRAYHADPWCGGDLSNGFVTDMITGMVEMFASLGDGALHAAGGGIAGGIAEALFTTQMGLAVAIPGYFVTRLLDRREARLRDELEQVKSLVAQEAWA